MADGPPEILPMAGGPCWRCAGSGTLHMTGAGPAPCPACGGDGWNPAAPPDPEAGDDCPF